MRNFRTWAVQTACFSALAAFSTGGSAYAQAPHYKVTDLGSLPNTNGPIEPFGINNKREIVGDDWRNYFTPTLKCGTCRTGFIWSKGVMTVAPSLTGSPIDGHPQAINSPGETAGYSWSPAGSLQPVSEWKGKLTDLDPNPTGYYNSAQAINDAGVVAGFIAPLPNSGATHAAIFSNGHVTDLGTLPGAGQYAESSAKGINLFGMAAGQSDNAAGFFRAVLFTGSGVTDLGVIAGDYSSANAINDAGHAVGWSTFSADDNGEVPTLFSNGTVTNLAPSLSGFGQAYGINNLEQIVGQYATGPAPFAFLWQNGVMLNLNTLVSLNTVLYRAKGIDDNGDIIAWGTNGHGYLLMAQ